MKKNITIWTCVVVIILGTVMLFGGRKNTPGHLPASFKITLYSDSTSSGGTRWIEEKYIFSHGVLKSGYKHYYDGEGGGCTGDQCTIDITCTISNGSWTGNGTNIPVCVAVPTIESLQQTISSGAIYKKDPTFCHQETCYSVTYPLFSF